MIDLLNYSSTELSKEINEKPFPYFFKDDFLKEELFKQLNYDFDELKNSNKIKWTVVEPPKGTRKTEENGVNYVIGGGGNNMGSYEPFKQLTDKYESWKYFIDMISSDASYEYFNDVFINTEEHQTTIQESIQNNVEWQLGCKISCFTNNYGYIIHPDNINKVLSFLLYLDNSDWDDISNPQGNGTQIWEVKDNAVKYDRDKNSIEYQLRSGRYSEKPESLKEEEADRVEMVDLVKFVPNRLVGFVRTNHSYHSIYPMVLPKNVTRNCFQINIWKLNRRY
tara:strand:- start:1690 stop:2529 length:840 start_codon:yes stop_codon:yes gene_type:complete